MYACMHAWMDGCMDVYIYVCMYVYVYVYMYMYMYMYVSIYLGYSPAIRLEAKKELLLMRPSKTASGLATSWSELNDSPKGDPWDNGSEHVGT